MAENENKPEIIDKPIDDKDLEAKIQPVETKEKTKPAEASHEHRNKSHTSWLIAAVIVLVILLFGGFIGSAAFMREHRVIKPVMTGFIGGDMFGGERIGRGMHRIDGNGIIDDDITRNQQQISGVVTAINDSNFTVAGDGVSNTVTTSSSTTYKGATKVEVNDSVTVIGTTNNGTFTASVVVVHNAN